MKHTLEIGVNVRAYGKVILEADNVDEAVKELAKGELDLSNGFEFNGTYEDSIDWNVQFPMFQVLRAIDENGDKTDVEADIETLEEVEWFARVRNFPAVSSALERVVAALDAQPADIQDKNLRLALAHAREVLGVGERKEAPATVLA
ncbi:hypothetical protein ACQU0X_25555 [Pseudovibrio ascidiaceicola]|uniref:hypothetical protein n=1 Tax=Pseudovibrio ascidiaceicola TaxID=285279 RepID=UPI003D3659EF